MLLGLIVGLCLPLLSPAHPIGIHAEKSHATRPSRRPGVAPPPATGPALLWRTAPATRPLLTTPAVGPDGTVYAATGDGTLYALAPDGHTLWMLHTAITTRLAPPALGPDGTSYWSLPGGPCRTAGGRRQPGAGGHGFLSGKHRRPGRQRRPPLVAGGARGRSYDRSEEHT